MVQINHKLTSLGRELETTSDALGQLAVNNDLLNDSNGQRQQIQEQGYLFFRGFFDRDQVMAVRDFMCRKLNTAGLLDPDYPAIEAIRRPETNIRLTPNLADNNPKLMRLLYSGSMIDVYHRLLGGPVRHFDYTWCRTISPGHGTKPHCDAVYMGRGTPRLYTSWTPIGDASYEDGGLMVMEQSHRIDRLRTHYCRKDVDSVCSNRKTENGSMKKKDPNFGALTYDPVGLRRNLGLRWLTTEYEAGDLVIFTIHTVHGSLDNHGARIRLSTDSRYQRADEPADDRWISIHGKPPTKHGENSQRKMIC